MREECEKTEEWKTQRALGEENQQTRRDGDGVYQHIATSTTRSWARRSGINGNRRNIGPAPYPTVSPATAYFLFRS